jgi:uncharacterized protein YndB with AHSA1/START domain
VDDMTADRGAPTLHLERLLPAPPARVFAAHLDPERLARWWGPSGFTAPAVEIDPRVGGGYRIAMQPPGGEIFHVAGEFREIAPPERLVYTFRWEEPHPDDRETVVALSLARRAGSTVLTVDQGPFATPQRLALHDEGWTQTLDRLEAFLAQE